MHEDGDVAAIETGQRKERGLAPAPVALLEDTRVGLDRRRLRMAAEDHGGQAALAAQRPDLLAEHGARTDLELRCISHVDSLP